MKKYFSRLIAIPGILVFKEKHGTYYFICNTPLDFCKAAMKVLKQRYEDDWYFDEDDEDNATAEYAGIIIKKKEVYKDKTLANRIIRDNDLEAAFEFIYNRSDHEYERVEIEQGETLE